MRFRFAAAPVALLLGAAICPAADDSKSRVKSIHELAKQGSGALANLAEYLADPDAPVRVEAVKSIVEIGGQRSLDPLIKATKDNDPEVQIRAVDGMVNFYLPGYVSSGFSAQFKRVGTKVLSKFTDTNDQVIPAYIEVRPDVIDSMAALVRGGGSMDVRACACRAIGVLRGKAASMALVEALRSKDDAVMYESLTAIQKVRDPSVAPRITFLLNDLNDKIRIAALETTGILQNKEALPQVRESLERARNDKVRRAALTALAMLPDESNRNIFSQYFQDKDDGIRAAAGEGYARLKVPADLPALDRAFQSERKNGPRLAFAFAAVSLGKLEVTEFSPLRYLLNTLDQKSYRGVARAYLIELTRDPGVRQAIYPLVAKGSKESKVQLSQILSISGDKESIPALEGLTKDPDAEVGQEALRALRALKTRLP